MKKIQKKMSSVDGFVPRRSGDRLGGLHDFENARVIDNDNDNENKLMYAADEDVGLDRELGRPDTNNKLGGPDINDSLTGIDDFFTGKVKTLSRKEKKLLKKQNKRPKSLVRRIIKYIVIAIILGLIGFGAYIGYGIITASNNIFQGGVLGIFKNQPLRQDVNGRSNFLILGTSEDDPGHEGASLTDSMMVVSIDQTKKDVYMFSIPRDLEVQYGTACVSGYSGKINAYFSCAKSGDTASDEQERLSSIQRLVGEIFGLDIQYSVHVNHTVIKQAVDAVGGIDVDIQGSNGAPGILDRGFDWKCNYTCYYVKYDNGIHHLDGIHALYLSMARGHSEPTYGLSRSNFDREINQQKIIMALKSKAMTTGILTDLGKVNSLISALGDNLRTNIKTEEIRTLLQLSGDIKPNDVHSVSLVDGDSPVMDGSGNPSAGMFEYDQIREFIKNNLLYGAVFNEAAPIVVLNGTGVAGFGKLEADKLTSGGFNVVLVGNAPEGDYTNKVDIYQIEEGNDATAKKLAELFNVEIKKTAPPTTVNGNVRFVVIFGKTAS
jgi:LCP family protein required for cell wall assembly